MVVLTIASVTLAQLGVAALELVALVAAVLLLAPSLLVAAQCLVAVATPLRCRLPSRTPGRVAVLVPAHDDEAGIGATVTDLRRQLRPGDRLLVVADDCSDRTADVARAAGADVVERRDPAHRGKGHALAFGIGALAVEDPPEAVVIVEADGRLSAGAALTLAAHATATGRPVQAEHVLDPEADGAPALGFVVRHRASPRALAALGLPCLLTGSGVALPWALAAEAARSGQLGGDVLDELLFGVDLALRGRGPVACVRAHVRSRRAIGAERVVRQRRRERGQLAALRRRGGRLLAEAARQRRPDLVAQALDLAVPPLAALVALLATLVAATGLGAGLWGTTALPLALALAGLAALGLGLGAAWWTFGRDVVPARSVLTAPWRAARTAPGHALGALREAGRRWGPRPRAVPAPAPGADQGEVA